MNKEDKARLDELKLKVWAKVARQFLEPDKDPDEKEMNGILHCSSIESHGGRIDKAIRLLTADGMLQVVKIDKSTNAYKILKMEEARAVESKPVLTKRWEDLLDGIHDGNKRLDSKVIANKELGSNAYLTEGYKTIDGFSEAEQIYLYFHPEEIDKVKLESNSYRHYEYYLKDQMTFRNKMVLKCLIELEMLYNFPQYLQMYAGFDKEAVIPENKTTFTFNKYAISSIFLNDKIAELFTEYTAIKDKANHMRKAFDMVNAWVDSVGGFEEAIRIIRKGIMADFLSKTLRFPKGLREMSSFKWKHNDLEDLSLPDQDDIDYDALDYSRKFKFIEDHKDLFTYDTLYGDTELLGETILQRPVYNPNRHYWSNSNDIIDPINLKEEFDEPENKGDDLAEQAA